MGAGSKKSVNAAPSAIQAKLPELSFSPSFFWQLFMLFAEYRTELLIKEVLVFPNGYAYYICPRCGITLEREFMAYCDRCGQHLGWKGYKKAKVVYPGCRKEVHT